MVLHVEDQPHYLGEVFRAKARLVARGFMLRERVDYLETFSPTPVPSSVRIIAVTVLQRDWTMNHYRDIEQAFVHVCGVRETSSRCFDDEEPFLRQYWCAIGRLCRMTSRLVVFSIINPGQQGFDGYNDYRCFIGEGGVSKMVATYYIPISQTGQKRWRRLQWSSS